MYFIKYIILHKVNKKTETMCLLLKEKAVKKNKVTILRTQKKRVGEGNNIFFILSIV